MYKLLLIWRYFIKKRVALIAVAGVTLLVMMVIVVLSLMSGLVEDARRRNHAWSGDLILTRASLVGFPYYDEFIEQLHKNDMVLEATPVIKSFALIDSDSSGEIYGVRLDEFCRVTNLAECLSFVFITDPPSFIVPTKYTQAFKQPPLTPEQRRRGYIVGIYAEGHPLGRAAGTNFAPLPITVFALNSKGILTGSQFGEHQSFYFINQFNTGLLDADYALLVDFEELQKLGWMDERENSPARTSEIRIKLKEGVDAEQARVQIVNLWRQFIEQKQNPELLADVTVQPWQLFRRDFIAPMEKEKDLMVIVFCMIGVVAVFIVFAIFYMIVAEKIKDLGILKSLGGSGWSLAQIFLGYGALVGIVGALVGTALGVTIVTNSNKIEDWLYKHFEFQLWDPQIYAIEKIPDTVDISQVLIIVAVAVLASIAGATIPARRAASLSVVDALRVE